MCGILGIATTAGERPSIRLEAVERMRDTMMHRGPDGAGLWDGGNIILAHRRLAVLDTSSAGAQPMVTSDGRFALVYNGELYNEPELRQELLRAGAVFRSESDTETVLLALAMWGPRAIGRFRGMYAIGLFDLREQTLLLSRDPLGIKPLYYLARRLAGQASVVFASEPQAILAHPDVSANPDLVTVSAYLTTIRTVMGHRTLFQDVCTLRPGETVAFDLKSEELAPRRLLIPREETGDTTLRSSPREAVRAAIEDSLTRHLRSDVPLCCLLSGGLDSSILAMLAMKRLGALNTYCSGAASLCDHSPAQRESEDFAFARTLAAAIGSQHDEVPLAPRLFAIRWREMVAELGIPLSTPNEVAIYEVSRRLRAEGHIVALSGEGADELFGGYVVPMQEALAYTRDPSPDKPSPGMFQLVSSAWITPELKPSILNEEVWRSIEGDGHLHAFYESEFSAIAAERQDETPLQAHLRFHRRINLAGLLQRLDTATMLASVEGRTPFADTTVCALAESLAMVEKFGIEEFEGGQPVPQTKRVLRKAFADDLPASIVSRPKASFPIPFQQWVAEQSGALQQCNLARELFTPAALHAVSANPSRVWQLSWPMVNIALWGQRWWG